MQETKFIGTIGVIVILTPLLGLPSSWKTMVLVLSGVILLLYSLFQYRAMSRKNKTREDDKVVTDTYVENSPSM